MLFRLIQLLIFECLIIIHLVKSTYIFNLTNTKQIMCHSCKGNDCEQIFNDDDHIILCNKHTQLCWAGFVDQKPYRTCASRFCTPSGISLDSDIRIETCCHSNLCNDIPLSWSIWSKWYSRSSTRRPEILPTSSPRIIPDRLTTEQQRAPTSRMYVVNEIVNNEQKSSSKESSEENNNIVKPKLKFNASNPETFGINWKRIPFEREFSNCAASISKLLILIMPILVVLLF